MSTSQPHPQDCTAVDQAGDVTTEDLLELIQSQQETINRLEDRVEQLEADQADHQERTARERAEDRQRLTDVEDRVEDLEDRPDTQGSTGQDGPAESRETPQTPLEQTVALPPELINEESANVQRAVFVARDVTDYTTKVKAGRVIKSSELRKVLKAGTGAQGHSQTVDRVISILDELGKGEIEVVDRRGERRVVFSEALTARLDGLTQASGSDGHGVVTGGTA